MIDAVSSTGGSGAATAPQGRSLGELSPEQFLKLLITQLQNQDPFEPVKNQDLLEQISAVRQLQSSMDLSRTLANLAMQQQISSAGSLIGKHIQGLNAYLDPVSGVVTSVTVEGDDAYLDLDTGQRVALKDVTRVSEDPGSADQG